MAGPLDPIFGIHAEAARVRAQRLEVIAGNIANADTPGYKARDVDFQAALKAAADGTMPAAAAADTATVYRTSTQPTLDGNTVDAQREQAAFGRAALEYQASLSFAEARLRSLLTAITGE